jgi:hypothetical protein
MIAGLNGEAPGAAPAPEGKPLNGIALVIAQEQECGGRKVLGVIFAQTVEKLREMVTTVHGAKITVSMADVRAGTLILKP